MIMEYKYLIRALQFNTYVHGININYTCSTIYNIIMKKYEKRINGTQCLQLFQTIYGVYAIIYLYYNVINTSLIDMANP